MLKTIAYYRSIPVISFMKKQIRFDIIIFSKYYY